MPAPRLLVMSDLHQGEGGPCFDPSVVTGAFDIVVVAGDCAGPLTESLRWLGSRFAGVPTIYVPGNHDFYRNGDANGFTIEEETEAGIELADLLGITLLVDRAVDMQGIRFLGATLWSDLRGAGGLELPQAVREARRGMNDYRRIHRRSNSRRSRRIDPWYTASLHRTSRRFLEEEFAKRIGAGTVVVTHHSPSFGSLSGPTADLSQCYASDMDAEIRSWGPDLWIHGHIHSASDRRVGATRILCNPLGRTEEETGFVATRIVTAGEGAGFRTDM